MTVSAILYRQGQEDLDLSHIEQEMFSTDFDFFDENTKDFINTAGGSTDTGNRNDSWTSSKVKSEIAPANNLGSNSVGPNILGSTGVPEEYISPKRRRRLNQIVPNPRKPRQVEYQCSCCQDTYTMIVQGFLLHYQVTSRIMFAFPQ